jgi:hypothetical protein
MNSVRVSILAVAVVLAVSPSANAQRGGGAGRGGPAASPRDSAALDLTGYWVSVITAEGGRVRFAAAER